MGGIALVAITGAMSLPAAAQAPLQPGDREITVTPSTVLTDGQTVRVAWTGFTANSKVTIIQCADAAGLKPETCNTGTALFNQDAGPAGEGSVELVVHTGPTGPDGECSATGNNQCVIAANEDLRDGITAIAPISFSASAPAGPATPRAADDPLANTGVMTVPMTITGTVAVLLGALLVRVSRRRNPGPA